MLTRCKKLRDLSLATLSSLAFHAFLTSLVHYRNLADVRATIVAVTAAAANKSVSIFSLIYPLFIFATYFAKENCRLFFPIKIAYTVTTPRPCH